MAVNSVTYKYLNWSFYDVYVCAFPVYTRTLLLPVLHMADQKQPCPNYWSCINVSIYPTIQVSDYL